jgi:DNA-nicking Smr family endonuclease
VDEPPVELPIDGTLDLHTFRPRDIKPLLSDYFIACAEREIFELRIIHGKGIGNLKRTVESILRQHPGVDRFGPASALFGGAGATIVWLKKK